MTKASSLMFALSLSVLALACDTGEDPVEERAAELDASPDAVDAERGHHARGERGHRDEGERAKHGAQRLCSEIACSDEQLAQITELFTSAHEQADPEAHEARKAAHRATNQAIADAFTADEFDVSVLEQAKRDHMGEGHEDRMIEMATGLHGILTPEQRATLADRIEAHGPMFIGHPGKRGHHGKWAGKRGHHGEGEHDPATRIAKKVDHMCEVVTCTEDQRTQLSATFEGVRDEQVAAHEGREGDKPDFGPLAAAFRAETFDAEAARAAMGAGKAMHEARVLEHTKAFAAVVAEIHDILTPEQRRVVAEAIAEHGLHAMMGKGKGKHERGEK